MKKEMKTSVRMVRLMEGMEVIQRTKDGYFDANDLLIKWNSDKENPQRAMSRFLDSPKTKEFIEALKEDNPDNALVQFNDNQLVKIVKGKALKGGGRSKDQVWMDPIVFLDFSVWLSPRYKAKVYRFAYDNLIKFRIEAGGGYKNLSSVGSRYLEGYDFALVARAMNHIIFGKEGKDLRQTATQEELKELDRLQDILIDSIEMGTITTFKELIENLQRRWCKKNGFDFQEEIERIEKERKRKKRK